MSKWWARPCAVGLILPVLGLVVLTGGLARAEGSPGGNGDAALNDGTSDGAVPDEEAVEAAVEAGAAAARGPVTSLPLPRFVSLRAETANARRGPSLSHRVDWEFRRSGWPLLVTAEYGHWRRVRDVEGAGGWVHHSLLSGARTAVVVGSSLAPLHATSSETSAIRAYAEPGVVVRLDSCDGPWCRVSIGRADGWVRRDTLWGTD